MQLLLASMSLGATEGCSFMWVKYKSSRFHDTYLVSIDLEETEKHWLFGSKYPSPFPQERAASPSGQFRHISSRILTRFRRPGQSYNIRYRCVRRFGLWRRLQGRFLTWLAHLTWIDCPLYRSRWRRIRYRSRIHTVPSSVLFMLWTHYPWMESRGMFYISLLKVYYLRQASRNIITNITLEHDVSGLNPSFLSLDTGDGYD